MSDRDTGRSKGFGFVEMGSPAEAEAVSRRARAADFSIPAQKLTPQHVIERASDASCAPRATKYGAVSLTVNAHLSVGVFVGTFRLFNARCVPRAQGLTGCLRMAVTRDPATRVARIYAALTVCAATP